MEVFPVSVPTGSLPWFCPSYHTVMGLAEQGTEVRMIWENQKLLKLRPTPF